MSFERPITASGNAEGQLMLWLVAGWRLNGFYWHTDSLTPCEGEKGRFEQVAPAPAAQAVVEPQLDEALCVLLLSPRSLVVTTSTDKRL